MCKKQCEMSEISMQKKLCKMRQFNMQKTTAKCVNFLQILRFFLHINLARFPVFFAGKFAENCMAIFRIFQAFSWGFFTELCAGMGKAGSRSNPGQNVAIPIGIALKILVFAARNQRKAKLAPKLENAVSDVTRRRRRVR